ncbi:MAG: hypothetical protein PHX27_02250, partial [Candidatus ainarchaeum sp.]|nr:hypothetical protein [Candidatus ainarchaeum sp.]
MNNSLEAIITLTALIAFITTILIGTIVLNENLREKQELLNTKNISNNCASIIDSFFSNSAIEFEQEFGCNGENNTVFIKQKNFIKKSFVITTVKKEKLLEVTT